jgi:RNA polymerase sigma-70 factor (ECF subfamily)
MDTVKKTGRISPQKKQVDEKDLVHRAKAGDAEAFTALYDSYMSRVYRYVFFRVADDQTAEDITSQVFLRAWEHLKRYRQDGSFLAWLYTIARNAVIDHYRTRKEVVPLNDALPVPTDGPTLQENVELKFETEQVRRAMLQLTSDQKEVLSLKFMAGFSTEEIAHHLGKREGAVRALQMRALRALAKEIKLEVE